jgi:hypothetical protein
MNNYFANYKCYDSKKRRLSIFGKETELGKLEIFELTCSKEDKFLKAYAKKIYLYPEMVVMKYYHPKIHTINIKEGDTAKFTFNTYCNDNFYHQYEGVARYEEKYLYKKGQPKIVLKSKRLNKFSNYA